MWSYSFVKSGKGHGVGTCIGNTQVATGKPSNKPPIWGSFIAPSCGDFGDGLWHWVYHITQDLSDDEVFCSASGRLQLRVLACGRRGSLILPKSARRRRGTA